MEHAVEWGLADRDLSKVTALGVDEIACHRGHTYLTLLYYIGEQGGSWRWPKTGRGELAFLP